MLRIWWLIGWVTLGISSVYPGTVMLAWDASATATSYRIYYGVASRHYNTVLEIGPALSASVGGLADGIYYFAATALNQVGESDYSNEVSAMVVTPPLDTTPPMVVIISPAPSARVSRKSTILIIVDAADNVGVIHVEFSVNGQLICTDTTLPYSCQWDVPAPPRRTYTLQARAYDAAGNRGTHHIQVMSI